MYILDGMLKSSIVSFVSVKLIGKLQDGTVFVKKGYVDEQPFEFKIDEGTLNNHLNFIISLLFSITSY